MIKHPDGKLCETFSPEIGTEFAIHEAVSKALGGVPFYFPPSYQPWQRS